MLRRVGLSTVRRAALARATFDEVNDPYMVDHIEAKTQEQLEEELGYNKKYPDYTDECLLFLSFVLPPFV